MWEKRLGSHSFSNSPISSKCAPVIIILTIAYSKQSTIPETPLSHLGVVVLTSSKDHFLLHQALTVKAVWLSFRNCVKYAYAEWLNETEEFNLMQLKMEHGDGTRTTCPYMWRSYFRVRQMLRLAFISPLDILEWCLTVVGGRNVKQFSITILNLLRRDKARFLS